MNAGVVADPGVRPIILFIGTSLTAGYGVDPEDAFPARIQARIDSAGLPYRVVNAGVSGETSAGALRRVDWVLDQPGIRFVVLETGANDGLRGQDLDSLRANLVSIVDRLEQEIPAERILLVGMEALPNLGRRYTDGFRAVFPELAERFGLRFHPFLLEGVAGIDSLNQVDGIHPSRAGHEQVAVHLWPAVLEMLQSDLTG